MKTGIDEFVGRIEAHAKKMARFYSVDLHVHSPESHDFPRLDSRAGHAKTIPIDDQISDLEERKEAFKASLKKSQFTG